MNKLLYILLLFTCFGLPAQTSSANTMRPAGSKPDTGLFVPPSFVPDPAVMGNGLYTPEYSGNDIFHPVMTVPAEYSLTVFNRWGQIVFSSKELYKGWNGYYKDKICPQGVYFWKINAVSAEGKKTDRQGSFYLLTQP